MLSGDRRASGWCSWWFIRLTPGLKGAPPTSLRAVRTCSFSRYLFGIQSGDLARNWSVAACNSAGHWAIISPDPEAEARRLAPHILYQSNTYIDWGAFGPPDEVPRFEDGETAIREGLYESWDAETAVTELTRLLTDSPEIRDIHFWAQFPGESLENGSRRIEYMAREVLPRLRESLAESR